MACIDELLIMFNLLIAIQGLNIVRICLPLDLREKVGTISLEKRMSELYFFGGTFALMEVIHIQLAHKRIEVVVLKICW